VISDDPVADGVPEDRPRPFMLDDGVDDAPTYADGPQSQALGPQIARSWLKARRIREDMFGPGLFSDPAWDILLDLYAAEAKGELVQITSLSIAAGIPHSTAIRWAKILTQNGLLVRQKDPRDARRIHISLSARASLLMQEYFGKLDRDGLAPVRVSARESQ
jgi:DNA-binding MarR family transcriptional regulator